VIYLDADTIVVHKIDEVFGCPGFCATLRHSERFNSGVMAISPSKQVFDSMIESSARTSSYTGCAAGLSNQGGSDGVIV
jgi:inositol phosphorylceramide glucuronosyltransferase 1